MLTDGSPFTDHTNSKATSHSPPTVPGPSTQMSSQAESLVHTEKTQHTSVVSWMSPKPLTMFLSFD